MGRTLWLDWELYQRVESLTYCQRRCRLAPAVRGTLFPDTPKAHASGLWEAAMKAMDQTVGSMVLREWAIGRRLRPLWGQDIRL